MQLISVIPQYSDIAMNLMYQSDAAKYERRSKFVTLNFFFFCILQGEFIQVAYINRFGTGKGKILSKEINFVKITAFGETR